MRKNFGANSYAQSLLARIDNGAERTGSQRRINLHRNKQRKGFSRWKKQVISFEKPTEMQASWHNSLLRTIVRCGIVKERLRGTILKRPTIGTSIYFLGALA